MAFVVLGVCFFSDVIPQLVLVKPTQEELQFITNTKSVQIIHVASHNFNINKPNNDVTQKFPHFKMANLDVVILQNDKAVEEFVAFTGLNSDKVRELPSSQTEAQTIQYNLNLKNRILFDVTGNKNVIASRLFTLDEIDGLDLTNDAKTQIILDQAVMYSDVTGNITDFTQQYEAADGDVNKLAIVESAKSKLQERDEKYGIEIETAKSNGYNTYLSNEGTVLLTAQNHLSTDPNKGAIVINGDKGIQTWE